MIIAITGVAGVGKTSVAEMLRRKTKWTLVRPDDIAKRKKLYLGYDKKRRSRIVDLGKLKKEIRFIARSGGNVIVESLYSHFLDADVVVVLRCSPDVLEKRLKRKYSWPTKILENKEAELIGVVTQEALDKYGRSKVLEFDTTKSTPTRTADEIISALTEKSERRGRFAGRISWM